MNRTRIAAFERGASDGLRGFDPEESGVLYLRGHAYGSGIRERKAAIRLEKNRQATMFEAAPTAARLLYEASTGVSWRGERR